MSKNGDATRAGVTDAWDFWLSQHPVSVPETIHDAANSAFTTWLNAHTDELIEAIAAKVAEQHVTTCCCRDGDAA